jgi:hypothetical protein
MRNIGPRSAIVLAFVLLASSALAQAVELSSSLSPKNEVPPNDSPASGAAVVQYDPATRRLSWQISYTGLTAPLSAAHFHGPATTAGNAGVVVPIAGAGAPSPMVGAADLSEPQAADLLAGRWYINLHTATHPGGELRGQVLKR